MRQITLTVSVGVPPWSLPGHLRLPLLAFLLVAAGCLFLLADMAVTNKLYVGSDSAVHIPGDIRRVITLSEVFGHGSGLLLIGLTVFVLDQASRRKAWRFLAIALGGGLAAALLKGVAHRTRPGHADLTGTVWETFQGWFPLASAGYEGQSIPSGHAAQAAALAIALAWLYPRGRWLFATFAVLAALQRIVSGAHFASDVCFGAAIGCVVGVVVLHPRLLGRYFDRWESSDPGTRRTLSDEVPAPSTTDDSRRIDTRHRERGLRLPFFVVSLDSRQVAQVIGDEPQPAADLSDSSNDQAAAGRSD